MDSLRPPSEVSADADLVRSLLESQFPDLSPLPVTLFDEGWDNFTFRVGRAYAVRLPRHSAAVGLLLNEHRWLDTVAAELPVRVPKILGRGSPTRQFPWPWSLVEWVPGTPLDFQSLNPDNARSLATALRVLHRPGHVDAPANPVRGVPLAKRSAIVEDRMDRLGLTQLREAWQAALEAPLATQACWIHGDLHPRNVIMENGRLVGLIDWGDLTSGDVATDLAAGWSLCEPRARSAFWESYRPTEREWARAAGWAINFATALLDSSDPLHESLGQAIAARITTGAP